MGGLIGMFGLLGLMFDAGGAAMGNPPDRGAFAAGATMGSPSDEGGVPFDRLGAGVFSTGTGTARSAEKGGVDDAGTGVAPGRVGKFCAGGTTFG